MRWRESARRRVTERVIEREKEREQERESERESESVLGKTVCSLSARLISIVLLYDEVCSKPAMGVLQ